MPSPPSRPPAPSRLDFEARYRLLVENSSNVISVLDPDGEVRYVSPACRDVLGYEPRELVGALAFELVHPQDRAAVLDAYSKLLSTADPVTTPVHRVRHKNGDWIRIETTGRAVRDPIRGEVLELHTSARDVTERMRVEEQLLLAHELALAIGESHTVQRALALVLRGICEKTGWALGQAWVREADSLQCSAAWHARVDGLEAFREASREMTLERGVELPGRVWATRRPLWVEDFDRSERFERASAAAAAGLRAGVWVPVVAGDELEAVLEFMLRDPRREDVHLVDLVAMVAAQLASLISHKRAEGELRESEMRYRLLADNSSDIITVTDAAGVIRHISPSCWTVMGRRPEELTGRTGFPLLHPDDEAAVRAMYGSVFATGRASISEPYRIQGRDGGWVWVESTLRPIVDPGSGEVIEVQASSRDVSERKRVQEQLERMHAELELRTAELERSNVELEQFAYDASHDLGEPLRVMSQLTRRLATLESERPEPEMRRLVTSIMDGVERMQMLITDLLYYSKVSREPPERVPVDCFALAEQTVELLEESIAEKGATVTCEDLPTIEAHPTQLAQLFQNLISNALKFSREGTPLEIHLNVERESAGWRFSVSDNGIGIDPRHAGRVFEMFRRLHPRDAYAGTGMGLSICKRIVERHGGRIWVEPASGGGSVFFFTIPDPGVSQGLRSRETRG